MVTDTIAEPGATEVVDAPLPPAPLPVANELNSAELDADGLDRLLRSLAGTGANNWDPVAFAFIAALLRRAAEQREPRATDTRARARAALARYLDHLHRARDEAATLASELVAAQPGLHDVVQQRLAAWDFRGLARLGLRPPREPGPGPLGQLVRALEAGAAERDDAVEAAGSALGSSLQAQEKALLGSFAAHEPARPELRSARHYRHTAQRESARRRVADSLASSPEDSGPLNPQKLAARALGAMQELSPACSAHYVAYIDTLFYLDSLRSGQTGR